MQAKDFKIKVGFCEPCTVAYSQVYSFLMILFTLTKTKNKAQPAKIDSVSSRIITEKLFKKLINNKKTL